jgi:hypothetical protein
MIQSMATPIRCGGLDYERITQEMKTEKIERIRRWCPNCEFHYKDLGLNCCSLVNYAHKVDHAAKEWLDANSDESTKIDTNADKCPRFVPYPEILQNKWVDMNGGLTDIQKEWYGKDPPNLQK